MKMYMYSLYVYIYIYIYISRRLPLRHLSRYQQPPVNNDCYIVQNYLNMSMSYCSTVYSTLHVGMSIDMSKTHPHLCNTNLSSTYGSYGGWVHTHLHLPVSSHHHEN